MLKEGDIVQIVNKKNRFFLRLKKGEILGTHKGNINHNDIIGKGYGDIVETHLGERFTIIKSTLYELIMYGIKRKTQIIYPKDSAYITLRLGITDGMKVLESGLGSGGLTLVMANAVKPTGKIYGYEIEESHLEYLKKNIQLAKLENYVETFHRDLAEPLPANFFDAAFIDVKEPWKYLENIYNSLKIGANIGFLLPTTNQVSELLKNLESFKFSQTEVLEILLRKYKPVPERLRPEDRMVAHTGYLIFSRKLYLF